MSEAILKRERYLERIRPYYDSDLVKVLTGIRRSGKSTILSQIMEEIKVLHPDAPIIYYDFEDFETVRYRHDPLSFYRLLKGSVPEGKKAYIFLDEIQHLDDFRSLIASIRAKISCSLFVTGSNSSLLKGELASELTGRCVEFVILPFTFRETCDFTGRNDDAALDEYLRWGGFPARFAAGEDPARYLGSLLSNITEVDIVEKRNLDRRTDLSKILSYTLLHSGEIISPKSIAGYTAAQGEGISERTCYSYLDFMEDAFLVTSCPKFDVRGKTALASKPKFYATDPGLITIQTGNYQAVNLGFVLETAVFNELQTQGYKLFTGKTYKGEIDFVAVKGTDLKYFQVAYLLSDDEVVRREFGAFSTVRDNFPKYVISRDSFDFSQRGITHLNALKFLRGEYSL